MSDKTAVGAVGQIFALVGILSEFVSSLILVRLIGAVLIGAGAAAIIVSYRD